MIYHIDYLDEAKEDIARLRRSVPQSHQKVLRLLEELQEHPTTGTGHPKPLSGDKTGRWSRRIDKKHRLIYRIEEEVIVVLVISA